MEDSVNTIDLCVNPAHSATAKFVDIRKVLENFLSSRCNALTIGQMCVPISLLCSSFVSPELTRGRFSYQVTYFDLEVASSELDRSSPCKTGHLFFVQSWFSNARSKDAMTRGSVNEDAVMATLSRNEFFIDFFECGTF